MLASAFIGTTNQTSVAFLQVIGTGIVMLTDSQDTINSKPLGAEKLGVIITATFPDAARLTVPKRATSYQSKAKKLIVQDLPVNQLVDWALSSVRLLATRKKNRKS